MQGKITSEHEAPHTVYAGIDVCKEWLDIHLHPVGQTLRVANSKAGLRTLKAALSGLAVARVVLEATSKYHRQAQRSLTAAGHQVAVVNPLRARLFAEACGDLAKTDRIDARSLARLGAMLQPRTTPPVPETIEALQELVRARTAMTAGLTALRNRLGIAATAFLKAELRRQCANTQRAINRLSAEIKRRIADDPDLARRQDILLSIPGIGPATAATLVADCPELGTLSAKAATLLAGLAPIARDTGNSSGQRHIKGGRQSLRNALYMAALTAQRVNPPLHTCYQRLRDNGKKPKVALTALMRKLFIIANTLIAQNRTWTPIAP